MNQAIFKQIKVYNSETVDGELTEEYELLLHEDVRRAARQASTTTATSKRPGQQTIRKRRDERTPAFAGRGSSNDWLVGAEGLEPTTASL